MRARAAVTSAVLVCGLSCSQRVVPSARSPVSVTMRRQVANAVDAGEGDHRIVRLRQRLAEEPGNLKVRLELISRYQAAGFPDLALEHARLAAGRFPAEPAAHLALAKALRHNGLQPEAVRVLSDFARTRPTAPWEVHSWMGILRDELRLFSDAERSHRQALAIEPGRALLHNNLGYNLLLQGKRDDAASEFRQALRLQPDSELARNNLGLALSNHPQEALLAWQSVADPATAHNNLAAVLIEENRLQEARRELEIALGYKRDHPAALGNLQLLSRLDGRPASIPDAPRSPWWKRAARVTGKIILGTGDRPAVGPGAAASR